MDRICCVFHEEKTPSMVLYEKTYKCFGCGAYGPIEALKLPKKGATQAYKGPITESTAYTLSKIKMLPIKAIRGLLLPYDERGYYLIYPDSVYYCLRRWKATNASKYYYPKGLKKQLFTIAHSGNKSELVVIEGQFNALSLAKVLKNTTIMSPGSANDLVTSKCKNYALQYDQIYIIVDKDEAGVLAGLALKKFLLKAGKKVNLYAMREDMNDILVKYGEKEVNKHIKIAMEMS